MKAAPQPRGARAGHGGEVKDGAAARPDGHEPQAKRFGQERRPGCSYLPGASRSSPLTRHFVMVITSVLVSTAMVMSGRGLEKTASGRSNGGAFELWKGAARAAGRRQEERG